MKKKKVCYLIHVSWRHIFQRPHIISLKLEQDFECCVIEKLHFKNLKLPKQKLNPKKLISIFQIPKSGKINVISKICDFYTSIFIFFSGKKDIIWITHPEQYKFIPKRFKGKVIYDCMDEYKKLGSEISRMNAKKYEDALVARADLIFVSSQTLFDKINQIDKAVLVRNGFLPSDNTLPIKISNKKNCYKISYFGTISTWFDFGIINGSLKEFDNINYQIIGPCSKQITHCSNSNRIEYTGPVEHSLLATYISDSDALIMPFTINEIVLAVDPVKLYEYINFGKCIISIKYPEIERFEPYVYFYENEKEYHELLEYLINHGFPAKYDEYQREAFLNENSWDARYALMKECIVNLFE